MALGGVLLPLPARAQSPLGVVRELSGEVHLNGFRMSRNSAIQAGQTITTGSDGQIWFTMGSDAFFLRPDSRLRLESSRPREALVDFLRLVSGALGATFQRGAQRRLVSSTSTIGIRGTGVYVESWRDETYACTCFGATEIESTAVVAEKHAARRIDRERRVMEAPFARHTDEEIARLESLAGRPNPFRS